jgi:phosphoglycolate phosphatase
MKSKFFWRKTIPFLRCNTQTLKFSQGMAVSLKSMSLRCNNFPKTFLNFQPIATSLRLPGQAPDSMKKSLLIFDFDGTIADTLMVALQILNELGADYGLPHVDRDQFVELKQKTVTELMQLSGLSWFQLPGFVRKARASFRAHLSEVHPVAGIPETLRDLQAQDFRMGILTSNTKEGVDAFLQQHDLQLFEFIHAPDSLFGKAKVIRKILSHEALRPDDVVMIGDELRDIEAAQKAGIDSVAVTWGFNTETLLQSATPSHVAHQPTDLLHLFG